MDSAKINGTLYARNRKAGDRIFLGGMHKSVKKLLSEKKVPLSLRQRLPILCDNNGIVAVPTVGIRDGVAPDATTDSTTCIRIDFLEDQKTTTV